MPIITLLTDFGVQDGYPGVMKGVIWNIAPDVQIADLSHEIPPQDIYKAAILLSRSAMYFPQGTIHVVVVDPGVGSSRRGIAARVGEQYFVGPDNGLITLFYQEAKTSGKEISIVHLDQLRFWLPGVSHTFHGRDIFAPTAAYLSTGMPLNDFGTLISDPMLLTFPEPEQITGGQLGRVTYIDHFGNLSTNISADRLRQSKSIIVSLNGKQIPGLETTFSTQPPGKLVALIDSSGFLAISVVNGNAANLLNAVVGDAVKVELL